MPYHQTPEIDRFKNMHQMFTSSIKEWPLTREDMLDYIGVKDKVCAEVGVWKGFFARRIADRDPKELHLVDLWEHVDNGAGNRHDWATKNPIANFRSAIELTKHARKVIPHKGMSADIAKTMHAHTFDFIYIDANHYYEAALADIKLWWRTLKPGGWMTGHDWNCRATDNGPRRAVRRFLEMSGLSLDLLTGDLPMSWGFRKPML